MTKDDAGRLRPFWLLLHEHHQSVAPELAPFVSTSESWAHRERQYKQAMAGDWFGFIAQLDTVDVGYLICAKRPMDWQATFDLPPKLWELLTLVVHPKARGAGIGSALLDAMDEKIAGTDTKTKLVGAVPANKRAVSLYQSRGYQPAWLILTRFQKGHLSSRHDSGVQVERVAVRGVDMLRPLWLALHHHHQCVSPGLGPWVEDEDSWKVIKELLIVAAVNGLLFAVNHEGNPIGFGSAAIYSADEMEGYSDTWETGERIAETKFLVVAEHARETGVGSAILAAIDRELAMRDASDHLIGAIAPNLDTISFYQSRGFQPAWLEMVRR